MSWLEKVKDLGKFLQGASWLGGKSQRRVEVHYDKYRNLLRSLRPKTERVAFTERDPRVNLFVEDGARNLYFIQFLLSGDAVEDTAQQRLVLRNELLASVNDEFERNDALAKFDEALAAQQQLLMKKNYYMEMEVTLPEFDFEKKAFEFEFPALLSNRSIALHDILLIWDVNLTGFAPHFRFAFRSPEEAKAWKQTAHGMRLGLLFHVVTHAPKLWGTGMPATLLYVIGFGFVDGKTGRILDAPPVQVFAQPGPHEEAPRNRADILRLVNELLEKA